jgi:hypothetical protein
LLAVSLRVGQPHQSACQIQTVLQKISGISRNPQKDFSERSSKAKSLTLGKSRREDLKQFCESNEQSTEKVRFSQCVPLFLKKVASKPRHLTLGWGRDELLS